MRSGIDRRLDGVDASPPTLGHEHDSENFHHPDHDVRPLDGRVAIVTGGGKGLGRAFALELARRGAKVVVNNRLSEVDERGLGSADLVVEEIEAFGGEAVADHGDAADPGTAENLVERAVSTWGRLDICVANAGVNRPQMLHKTTEENFRAVMDINVVGAALLVSAASRVMREAGHGRVIVVGSTSGLHGELTVSAYSASKGAVIALARAAAGEGERRDVLTNVVLPYATTQMTTEGMNPLVKDLMSPEAVGPVVAALADPTSTINGQVVVTGADGLRAVDVIEHGTVRFPAQLGPEGLVELLAHSRQGRSHTYSNAQAAFLDFAKDLTEDEVS